MRIFWRMATVGAVLWLLTGCVTYPYETAFAACDGAAGACYDYCEQFADAPDDYAACHADCDAEANQCFADSYDQYRYARSGYGYSAYGPSPWYGRYGYWYPDQGYIFSFSYYGNYGYRDRNYRRHSPYNRRDRHRRRDHNDDSGVESGRPPPGISTPPTGERRLRDREERLAPRERDLDPPYRGGGTNPPAAPPRATPAPTQSAPSTQSTPPSPAPPASSPPPQPRQQQRPVSPRNRNEGRRQDQ